ncbi:MAG TPA: hypothetical protein VK870_13810 [Ignavibacteriaceae bacterium]|nr:hypothetical protein [Ignavibacteriaceae bacterium]
MKIVLIIFLVLGTSLLFSASIYDKERAPYTYVISSENGNFIFKMFSDGKGIAYEVTENSYNKEIWKVEGWYAFKTFITNDGQYLIRIGNWPRGDKPSEDDLAIAFYEKDKLMKSYSTRELIKDDSLVPISVSHYEFMKEQPYLDGFRIILITVDGIAYKFDVTNGLILSSDKN